MWVGNENSKHDRDKRTSLLAKEDLGPAYAHSTRAASGLCCKIVIGGIE